MVRMVGRPPMLWIGRTIGLPAVDWGIEQAGDHLRSATELWGRGGRQDARWPLMHLLTSPVVELLTPFCRSDPRDKPGRCMHRRMSSVVADDAASTDTRQNQRQGR